MKTIKLSLLFVALIFAANAQQSEKYVKAMQANLQLMKDAKTPAQINKVSNAFERIASSEKNEWLPYYYSALNTITQAYKTADVKMIDELVDKAEGYLDKADLISKKNSEIYVLKSMCKNARIMADPQTRGRKFGAQSAELISLAKEFNPENPRVFLNQAYSKMYTPEAYGGGKKLALPLAEAALEKFKSFKPTSVLEPNWGMDQAEELVKQCSIK